MRPGWHERVGSNARCSLLCTSFSPQAKLVEQSRANLLNSALPGLALSSPRGSPQQQPGVPAPDAGVAAGSATAGSGSQGVEGAAAAGKGGEGRSGTARGGGCRVEVLVDNVMSGGWVGWWWNRRRWQGTMPSMPALHTTGAAPIGVWLLLNQPWGVATTLAPTNSFTLHPPHA